VQYLVPPPTSSVGGIFIVSANLNGDTKPDIALKHTGLVAATPQPEYLTLLQHHDHFLSDPGR
jgi:hypothetical protein